MSAKRVLRVFHTVAAASVVGLIFVQVYLIGEYVYGNAGALLTHESVGKAVPFLELFVFLTALAGWWPERRQVALSLALLIVGGVQVAFATNHFGSNPAIRALHPMLALAVVLLAVATTVRAWRLYARDTITRAP